MSKAAQVADVVRVDFDTLDFSIVEQIRELDEPTVEQYQEGVRAGDNFPPIVVFSDGTRSWVADGRQRSEAFRRESHTSILAELHGGGEEEAFEYALSSNAGHGLPRSPKTKKHVVSLALSREKYRKWSDRQVAKLCRVSHTYVANVRREMKAGGNYLPPETHQGADGKEYPATQPKRTPPTRVVQDEDLPEEEAPWTPPGEEHLEENSPADEDQPFVADDADTQTSDVGEPEFEEPVLKDARGDIVPSELALMWTAVDDAVDILQSHLKPLRDTAQRQMGIIDEAIHLIHPTEVIGGRAYNSLRSVVDKTKAMIAEIEGTRPHVLVDDPKHPCGWMTKSEAIQDNEARKARAKHR